MQTVTVKVEVVVKRRRKRKAAPCPVTHFKAKVDYQMKTVRFNYALPTARVDGTALATSEIDYVSIQMSADKGETFQEIGKVPPTDTSFEQRDLVDGDYEFRAIVVDKEKTPKQSAPVDIEVEVLTDLAAPNPVTNFAATVVNQA